MEPQKRFEVLVAGRGPAGLAASIALAERGIEVVSLAPVGASPALARAEMLSRAVEAILVRLGLGDVLARAVRLRGVERHWNGARRELQDGLSPDAVGPGWSVDRADLQEALTTRAAALGVTEARGHVRGVDGQPGRWRVTLSDGDSLEARFLVDATGRPAALARRLGAKPRFGLPLLARVWTAMGPAPSRLVAKAEPDGWRYTLPHPAGGASVGWLTRPGLVRDAPPGSASTRAQDARSMQLSPVAGPGWLAAGDSAAAFDPIASQGLFNALSGGFFAGNAAADAVRGAQENITVYRLLTERTAARTHRLIPSQYAASGYRTSFWAERAQQTFLSKGVTYGL